MILRFRLGNFRSFRDDVELSLVATALGRADALEIPAGEEGRTVHALPLAGVFGANASGKSNLLRGLDFMRTAVIHSHSNWPPTGPIERNEFRFDESCKSAPSLFELDFVQLGLRYQYGFELDSVSIRNEWLYSYPRGRRLVLFEREENNFLFGKTLTGPNRATERITRPNALFLSAAATANHELLTTIYRWFEQVQVIRANTLEGLLTTRHLLKVGDNRRVTQLLRHADLGIEDVTLEPIVFDERSISQLRRVSAAAAPEGADQDEFAAFMVKQLMDQDKFELLHCGPFGSVPMPYEDESLGTQTWFSLIGPVLRSIDEGGTLLVDEIDASLHPLLIANALKLYQTGDSNPLGAQLIFTAHDTTPLSDMAGGIPLNRDEVWLTEKGSDGSTTLTALSEFRPRKGENLQRGYLQGRYGGTPRRLALDFSRTIREKVQSE